MKLLIQVTQTHITEGHRGQCSDCPVTLALIDSVKGAKLESDIQDILSYTTFVGYTTRMGRITLNFPDFVKQAIQRFDMDGKMEPFGFEIELKGL